MILISRGLVVSEPTVYGSDNPLIGWHNVVRAANIVADTAATGFPASNLANANTSVEWRANDTTEQYITITTEYDQPIDYIGIARHNFGTGRIAVAVEGFTAGVWAQIVDDGMPGDDRPLILRFDPEIYSDVRLHLFGGVEAARAAVVYMGKLLVMERGLYVGHAPLTYARKTEVANGRAESGNFLGRIVTGSYKETSAKFDLLDPDWHRLNLEPFCAAAQSEPFFWAWRPATYPLETGFAALINDPMPTPADPSHLTQIEFQMRGVA